MSPEQKRRVFQKVKSMTAEKFWGWQNWLHSQAYAKAEQHYIEAMSTHPRISKTMVEQVKAKAAEIREQWDGMSTITVGDAEGAELQSVMGGDKIGTDQG